MLLGWSFRSGVAGARIAMAAMAAPFVAIAAAVACAESQPVPATRADAGTDGAAAGGAGGGASGAGGAAGQGANAGASGGPGGAGGSSGAGGDGGTGGAGGGPAGAGGGGGSCKPPVSGTCSLVPPCGCDPAQQCDVVSPSGTTACVTIGTVPEYWGCSGPGDCAKGLSCAEGACKPPCQTPADCTGKASPYQTCSQAYAKGNPVPSHFTCTRQCNPVSPSASSGSWQGCGPKMQCIPVGNGTTDCIGPSGTGVDLSKCGSVADCQPGFTCVAHPKWGSVCLLWCMDGKGCSGTLTCKGFTPPMLAGTSTLGVCD